MLLAGIMGCTICCSGSGKKTDNVPDTGILIEPYHGKIDQDDNGNFYMESRFVVAFNQSISKKDVESLTGGKVTGAIPQAEIFEVETTKNVDDAVSSLEADPKVEFAGRNYYFKKTAVWDNDVYKIANSADPTLSLSLWWSGAIGLSKGLNFLQSSGAKLTPVTIAILDENFNLDLDSDPNKPEIPYVDKKYHFDFADNDTNVRPPANLMYSHGSNVAAFAAALNNGQRTNGVAALDDIMVLPYKLDSDLNTLDQVGNNFDFNLLSKLTGDDFRVAAALYSVLMKADELNIKVVNMSFGALLGVLGTAHRYDGYATKTVIQMLKDKGIIVVAGAGNDNSDACSFYPSAFPGVISVGGTYFDGQTESRFYLKTNDGTVFGSNFSTQQDCLETFAPAQNILTFDTQGNPATAINARSGTSFSSPQVAGLVALMKAVKPDLTFDEAVSLMIGNNADEITFGVDDKLPAAQNMTVPRINVEKSLRALIGSQNQPQLCVQYPDAGFNRFTFTVNDVQHDVCGSTFNFYLNQITADGKAEFLIFDPNAGISETNQLDLYQQWKISYLTPQVTVELCDKTPPCTSGTDCKATLAWDTLLLCP